MKSLIGMLIAVVAAAAAFGAPLPYDSSVDARVAVDGGIAQAKREGKYLLLVFGANWCEDCRDLDKAMRGSSAPLIGTRFVVVKVDVGNFDHNLDIAQRYGNPIAKGIPAAVLLTPDGQMLHSTGGGELANARRMGDKGIYGFLSRFLPAQPPP